MEEQSCVWRSWSVCNSSPSGTRETYTGIRRSKEKSRRGEDAWVDCLKSLSGEERGSKRRFLVAERFQLGRVEVLERLVEVEHRHFLFFVVEKLDTVQYVEDRHVFILSGMKGWAALENSTSFCSMLIRILLRAPLMPTPNPPKAKWAYWMNMCTNACAEKLVFPFVPCSWMMTYTVLRKLL